MTTAHDEASRGARQLGWKQPPPRSWWEKAGDTLGSVGDWMFGEDPQPKFDALRDAMPQPVEKSPYLKQFQEGFSKYSAKPPWEMDPTQTAMYKASMLDIGEKAQARAQGQMRRAAARGGGSLQTGAATAMGNEQARRLDAAQTRAADASAQNLASQHASYLNSLAQGMNFEGGLMDIEFLQAYRAYLLDQDLTFEEIEAEVQRVTEGWKRVRGIVETGTAVYTAGQTPGAP
jgi:hypothetical protein